MSLLSPEVLRIVRIDELLENVAGSEEVACMVINEFLVHAGPQLADIDDALAQQDLGKVAATLHRFKGSLAAVSAVEATAGVGAMELAARRRDLEGVRREFAGLCQQVEEVQRVLGQWQKQCELGGNERHG